MALIIKILIFPLVLEEGFSEVSKLVNTAQGPVRGYINTKYDIYEFFGIPYATAPNSTKRFTAPLPPPTWTEVLDAVDKGIICPQLNSSFPDGQRRLMQENCLIANIHVPNTNETNLPVLVVVFGGAYYKGFGHSLAPRRLAGTKKVVTVTFNYRLGAHGFLCLGTKDAPGNAGLKDQVALLRWVRDNIVSFGGNPKEVTLSGYSSGASAVDLLMISKAAEGLFNKVIPESGANIASWSVNADPVRLAKDYATLLNFENVDDLVALEEFYKTVPYEVLNSVLTLDLYNSAFYFSPCIENNLGDEVILNDSPVNIIRSGQYKKVPLLYGFTDMEGLYKLSVYDDWVNVMNDNFSGFLPGDLEFKNQDEKETVAQIVRHFYFGDGRIGINTIFGYINFFSDTVFTYPMLRSAEMQIEAGHDSIYLYEYTFYKRYASVPGVPDALLNPPGAEHCAQSFIVLDNVFEENIPPEAYTEEYRQMRTTMVELWINFITTGRPVPEGSPLPAWPPAAGRAPHMHLGDAVELRNSSPMAARAQLWDDIYERYYRQPRPPHSGATSMTHIGVLYFLAANVSNNIFF